MVIFLLPVNVEGLLGFVSLGMIDFHSFLSSIQPKSLDVPIMNFLS